MGAIDELSDVDRTALIQAIATREGTASEIAKWFEVPISELKQFVQDSKPVIEAARTAAETHAQDHDTGTPEDIVSPAELDKLWLGKKAERLQRYQEIADILYTEAVSDTFHARYAPAEQATILREFRSYLTVAANELGQLLHRGAGEAQDGDTVGFDFGGVDAGALR